MQIDIAKRREIEHPLRNDAAVADDDDRVWFDGGDLSPELIVGLDALGLRDGQVEFERRFLDWRSDEFQSSTSFSKVGTAKRGVPQKMRSRGIL